MQKEEDDLIINNDKPRPGVLAAWFIFFIFVFGIISVFLFKHILSIYHFESRVTIIFFTILTMLAGIVFASLTQWYMGYIFNFKFLSIPKMFSLNNFKNISIQMGSRFVGIILFPIFLVVLFIISIECVVLLINMIISWPSGLYYTKEQFIFFHLIYLAIWFIPPIIFAKIDGHKNPFKNQLALEDASRQKFAWTRAGKYWFYGLIILVIIDAVRDIIKYYEGI